MIIGIIGVGYVGLPLAIAFAKYYKVICYITENQLVNLYHLVRYFFKSVAPHQNKLI